MRKLERRTISGARVQFDRRTTAEANANRDMRNYVTEEQPLRRSRWEARKRKEAKAAA
jgi:hypothetical protein